MSSTTPFPLPPRLPTELERIHHYWEELRRALNPMPFWDDVNLSKLGELARSIILIEVFHDPMRFRFNIVGDRIAQTYGSHLTSRFIDELERKSPLEYFAAQAIVTVEAMAPTYYRHVIELESEVPKSGYSRIILPLWGEGEVRKLLAGIGFE